MTGASGYGLYRPGDPRPARSSGLTRRAAPDKEDASRAAYEHVLAGTLKQRHWYAKWKSTDTAAGLAERLLSLRTTAQAHHGRRLTSEFEEGEHVPAVLSGFAACLTCAWLSNQRTFHLDLAADVARLHLAIQSPAAADSRRKATVVVVTWDGVASDHPAQGNEG